MYGIFEKRIREFMAAMAKTVFFPIFIIGCTMIYGIFLPGNHSDVGIIFSYPIYDSSLIQTLFTSGSWLLIYFLCWFSAS